MSPHTVARDQQAVQAAQSPKKSFGLSRGSAAQRQKTTSVEESNGGP
jgi:hypothetical protein